MKPEVAQHEVLFELEQELQINVRFAWVMLPSQADREGRFKWRVAPLKLGCIPYDDVDFSRVLDAWLTRGMLVKYRVKGEWYGWIPTWKKHQAINNREILSELPSFEEADESIDYRNQKDTDASSTRGQRVTHASQQSPSRAEDAPRGEGKGREGKGREGVFRNDASSTRQPDDKKASPLTMEQVHELQSAYPKGIYLQSDWLAVEKLINAQMDAGIAFERILASFHRYAAQQQAKGNVGSEYIRSPAIHCDISKPLFDEPFEIPPTKAERRTSANFDAVAQAGRELFGEGR